MQFLFKFQLAVAAALVATGLMVAAAPAASAANPLPYVNQPLVPNSASPGGTTFTLTVNGAGFVSGAAVGWNGSALATTFVSATKLTATVTAMRIASAGTAAVTVTNPAPGGGTSNAVLFSVVTSGFAGFSESDFAAAHGAGGAAVGDLNGDGHPDLVLSAAGKVSVLLGTGNGAFHGHVDYANGTNANGQVLLGDFNGDGKLDVVVLEGVFFVMLGNGDGTLQPSKTVSPAFAVNAAVAADFNGDGKLDLLACGYDSSTGSSSVVFLQGNGDGTFQSGITSIAGGAVSPLALAIGDLDGDGKLDVVVANASGFDRLLGNGDGTFQSRLSFATLFAPALALVDLNGDGKLDIVATLDATQGQISVQLGNGDGTFQTPVNYPAGDTTSAIVTGDFNGDGKLDVAALNYVSSTISLLLGNGDGTLQAQQVFTPTYLSNAALAAADFNGDGRLDLVTTSILKDNAEVFLQDSLTAPKVSLSPSTLMFPKQVLNTTSAPISTLLINEGNTTLKINKVGIATNNSSDFSVSFNGCGSMLAPGARCTLEATFTPTASGNRGSLMQVRDSGVNSPQNVTLSGVGTAISLSPTGIPFGNQKVGTTSAAQNITLTNVGKLLVSFTGSKISISGANPQDFIQQNTCGSSIAAGASCTISVSFKPTATGRRTASVSVSDNGGGSPQKVSLVGTGT